MLSIIENSIPLTEDEKRLFLPMLKNLGLDENLWNIYEKFLSVSSSFSSPCIIRVMEDNKLVAHFYMMKCRDYGPSLSKLTPLHAMIRAFRIPVYCWIKSGIGPENNANPGFYVNPDNAGELFPGILQILRKHYFMLLILDFVSNENIYAEAVRIPYPDDGLVDTAEYDTIDDYLKNHRNLKKKLKEYSKHGGVVELWKGKLPQEWQQQVKSCVKATASRSVFQLPYQELYADMCLSSTEINNEKILHFICRSENQFLGYHSFMCFDNQIRCLHGAFNREMKSTFHAYENMIYKVVEYAIERRIRNVWFGPVLNETKKRMMNRFNTTRLFIFSKYPLIQKTFSALISRSRMTDKDLLAFAGISEKSDMD
jgi:hypothetical protein